MTCQIRVGQPREYFCPEPAVALLFDHHADAFRVCREHLEHYVPEITAGLMTVKMLPPERPEVVPPILPCELTFLSNPCPLEARFEVEANVTDGFTTHRRRWKACPACASYFWVWGDENVSVSALQKEAA